MATLFGRRKSRPRQSSVSTQDLNERSVPYDMTIPSRSPIPVGTLTQSFRGISAPNTNPSLTVGGTEFNKFTTQRNRNDREGAHEQLRPGSPAASASTADSSTLYDETTGPFLSPSKLSIVHPQTARIRRAEARGQSQDFGQFPYPSQRQSSPSTRPSSGTTLRSEANRHSKYAASLTSSDGSSQIPFHVHQRQASESFHFPRPPTDEEVEILFEKVKLNRGDPKGFTSNLTIDQKWELVRSDEQMRWIEQKRGQQSRKPNEPGQQIPLESPQWYIQKFMDGTITPKQASGLNVCLRSKEMR